VNRKYGYVDRAGKIVIEPQYEWAGEFSEGLGLVSIGKNKWLYIDKIGKIICIPEYDSTWTEGNYIVPGNFSEGFASICVPEIGRWAFIDKKGKMAINSMNYYTDRHKGNLADDFSEGLAAFFNGKNWGYTDKQGSWIIPPRFDSATSFSGGMAQVWVETKEIGEKCGCIDKSGEFVVPPEYDFCMKVSESLALVMSRVAEDSNICRFFDKSGELVLERALWNCSTFSEGLATIVIATPRGLNYGFMDIEGKDVIPPQFKVCSNFSEGLAAVRGDGKWGYIDKLGKVVIQPQFDGAEPFNNGLARVQLYYVSSVDRILAVIRNVKNGYIDKTGKYVWKPTN
jgi:hypothetical protein